MMDFRDRWMMFGMYSPRTSHAILSVEDLPEPLQQRAEAMRNAKTRDEAKAAASEFLTLSEEWLDSGDPAP